jgi:hypothetical protein
VKGGNKCRVLLVAMEAEFQYMDSEPCPLTAHSRKAWVMTRAHLQLTQSARGCMGLLVSGRTKTSLDGTIRDIRVRDHATRYCQMAVFSEDTKASIMQEIEGQMFDPVAAGRKGRKKPIITCAPL